MALVPWQYFIKYWMRDSAFKVLLMHYFNTLFNQHRHHHHQYQQKSVGLNVVCATCQGAVTGIKSELSASQAYPEFFCHIVGEEHRNLFAKHIADRLGFHIILQHRRVNHEIASTIFSYLSGLDAFGIPKGGERNGIRLAFEVPSYNGSSFVSEIGCNN
jgi:hypothetical protein